MRGPALIPGDDERVGYNERGIAIGFESPECVAKRAIDPETKSTRQWVRRASPGPSPGSLFNPQARYYQMAAPANLSAHDSYLWCPVTAACFDAYLRFLATSNAEYLHKAERLACQRTN